MRRFFGFRESSEAAEAVEAENRRRASNLLIVFARRDQNFGLFGLFGQRRRNREGAVGAETCCRPDDEATGANWRPKLEIICPIHRSFF